MEETNFVLLWKEHYEKIDESLAINRMLLLEITHQKAQSALRSLIRLKTMGILAALIYLALLVLAIIYAVLHYSPAANYFIVSITAICLINIKALYDYIKHIAWVNQIDYSGSITNIQTQLTRLQLSIFKHTRVMFLQLPFWTTFYLSSAWFPQQVSWVYLVFQLLFTAVFTWAAHWLYKNISLDQAHKKWMWLLINGSGGKHVQQALTFFKEIEQFKQG
jgi:lysylphosphatidylglycerol synthetase-like protein (DUF2156 family)